MPEQESRVRLGAAGDAVVAIDIHAVPETNLGVVGNPGSGKSRTIRRVLELAAGRVQRIVIDVEDEFYTLREQTPSMILAGGEHGDCPATVDNAASLALFLLRAGVDAVLQINDLGLDGQRRFISAFLSAAVDAPRDLWHPTIFVLDEVQRYAPLSAPAESSAAISRFLMQGRKRSFGALLATTRQAVVSTDVRGMVNNWLLGRAAIQADRGAVADLLGFSARSQEALALRALAPGQFWAFGPAIGSEPVLAQIDPSETTHIRPGQHTVPTPPAPAAIRKMLEQLRREATPPAGGAGGAGDAAAPASKAVDDRAIAEARQEGYERGLAEGVRQERQAASAHLAALREQIEGILGEACGEGSWISSAPPAPRPIPAAREAARRPPPSPQPERGNGALPTGAQKLLAVLSRGLRLSWGQTAMLAGLKARGGSFNTARKALRDGGYIVEDGDVVAATAHGIASAGGATYSPSSPEEALEFWQAALPPAARRLLEQINRLDGWTPKEKIGDS